MASNRNNTKREDLLLFGVLLLPVIWFALLLAPCLGGSLVGMCSPG